MVKVSAAQWIGKRVDMEDCYAVRHFPDATLAVVCDGMGGHDCGAVAAQTASTAFADYFATNISGTVPDRLKQALTHANEMVATIMSQRKVYGGCTLLAVYVMPRVMWWLSVGDSPLLLWRNGCLLRLNEDHSMRFIYTQNLTHVSFNDRLFSKHAHALRSAVTGENIPLVDAPPTPYLLLPGDRIVLASDGVDELLLRTPLPSSAKRIFDAGVDNLATDIIEACRDLDEPDADNVTVLCIDK